MLFCSPVFFFFFAAYVLFWFLIPPQRRLWLIIFGSLVFYGYWNWHYVFIPVLLTLVSYLGGVWIWACPKPKMRKLRLAFSIALLISPLIYYKYINFFTGREIVTGSLPLGISFVTFTLIAYLVDVYRKTYSAEASFSWLTGFVVFFPQLIAGPILRPAELLPQLKSHISVTLTQQYQAICIFTLGLAKKMIFADQIKIFVDQAFMSGGGGDLWPIALYGFPVQVYCDFSGYSDMAIGLALFFGIHLPINFDRPYLAASITEIWRRWHITLSFWFRDYVYFVITEKDSSLVHRMLAKLFTMILCGIWHGAAWTFILYGGLHGVFLGAELWIKSFKIRFSLPRIIKILITFHLWAFALIIFRAPDMSKAIEVAGNVVTFGGDMTLHPMKNLGYPILLMVIFYVSHPFDSIQKFKDMLKKTHPIIVVPMILILWLTVLTLGATAGGSSKFVYFEF